ncbi:MAG: hypothetical protein ICV73_26550, partial [Acetobacteraceae bacterium]|nr:hypothetical protein [Acetobacteraceae bacterium]
MAQSTAPPAAAARDTAAADVWAQLRTRVEQRLRQFEASPPTPAAVYDLEQELRAAFDAAGRALLEAAFHRREPAARDRAAPKVRYRRQTYRRNKRTPARVATSFGPITLWSWLYLAAEDGEPGLHPLHVSLGVGAGGATPLLAERVARAAVEHTQAEVRAWLRREHGLSWSNDRLRAALRDFRRGLAPFVPALQQARVVQWLGQAEQSRGRHRPVLAVGRDGIMVPMRGGGYAEASTATVTVYDRRRRRLGTAYLGRMPEAKQTTLSQALTALVQGVLRAYPGPVPRLAYVTDKGSAPEEFYRRVLKKMKHPRDGKPLAWEWVLDFYHVCGYVGQLAEALFGAGTVAAARWFAKMRRWLRERRQGAAQVARSALQLLDRRKRTKAQQAAFWKAYRSLRRHRRWMDYAGYRRRGLPIGSGVTEAACKTVFTQRFKRSGMRWGHESGQVILDLRV